MYNKHFLCIILLELEFNSTFICIMCKNGGISMNTIITIGRQFGSAGREIGEKVAEYFGIKYYDKELLTRAAKETGNSQEKLENHEEPPTNTIM